MLVYPAWSLHVMLPLTASLRIIKAATRHIIELQERVSIITNWKEVLKRTRFSMSRWAYA